MKYSEALKALISNLEEQGHEESELDAWYLMEEISGLNRAAWFLHSDETMPKEMRQSFFELGERLLLDEPISYIIGSREFMGLNFHVNNNVLIPRQDTELLVEEAINEVKSSFLGKHASLSSKIYSAKIESGNDTVCNNKADYRILDLCTGSGCIAVSLAKFLDKSRISTVIDASDISDAALEIAKLNSIDNSVDVTYIKSNMFEQIVGKYDMIISNPPYIPGNQLVELDKKILEYEPRNALYGGEDGLEFYRIIATQAGNYLKQDGRLLLEIGFDQGETVPQLLAENGFKEIEVLKDYNGLDRVVKAIF